MNARIASIQGDIDISESDYQKEKLQERLAKLTSGVSVIKIGAPTEVELREIKMRVEDALCAARAAKEEGILPGGGVALLEASRYLELDSDVLINSNSIARLILIKALKSPIKQLALNAGLDGEEIIANIFVKHQPNGGFDFMNNRYVDLYEAGIIDPFKVTRLALENAASVAGMMLTTEVVIAEDETYDEQLRLPKLK